MLDESFEAAVEAARTEFAEGDRPRAILRFRELATLAFDHDAPNRCADLLFELTSLCAFANDGEEAMRAYVALVEFNEDTGFVPRPGDMAAAKAEMWLAYGEPFRAIRSYVDAAEEFASADRPVMQAAAIARVARIGQDHLAIDDAIKMHELALQAADLIPGEDLAWHIRVTHLDFLAKGFVAKEDRRAAIDAYGRLQDVLLLRGHRIEHAEVGIDIGALHAELGQLGHARTEWELARDTFIDLEAEHRADAVIQGLVELARLEREARFGTDPELGR